MNHGRKFAFFCLLLSILMLPRFTAAQAKQPAILQMQNNGVTAGTAANFHRINFTSGCTVTFTNGSFNVACTGGAGNPGGSANQIQYNNAGTSFGAFTMTGDCSIVVATGVMTCTESNGTAFGTAAFISSTAGGDLTGTLPSPTVAGLHFGSTPFTLSTGTPPSSGVPCLGYINSSSLGGIACGSFTPGGNLSGSSSSQNVIGALFGSTNFSFSTGTPPSVSLPCFGYINSSTLGGVTCGSGTFPGGNQGNTVVLSASGVGAAVTNTVHSSAFTPGTDLATILAGCGATPIPCRVYLDPSNTAIPTTGATIGSTTQEVAVIDEGVALECTGTSGANCISEGVWGSLVCDRKGPSATPSGCTIYTSSSANITSMFTNADHTGAQTDVVLKGFNFKPAAAATIINAAIWLVAVEGKGIIEGNGVLGIAGTNSSCNGEPAATFCDVSIEDGPSTGAFNNLTFKNNAFYGAGIAGNVSINIVSALSGGTGSGSVLTFLGTNVGDGLGGTGCISGVGCAINIDGSTGLAGSCTTTCHFVQSILFDGLYAESTSGQTGNFIEVRNCRDCVFNNVSFNGGPALTTGLSITESAAGRNGRIHIDGFLNGSRATNIVNNAVTGYASGNAKPDFDYTAPGDSSIGTYNDGPTTIAGVATIGASGAGTIAISNSANTFTNTLGSVATANNTFDFPAAVFTNGHIGYCAVTGVICTWTDAGYSYNALPLADHATQTANTLVANVTGSTAAPTAATIPAGVQFYTAGTGYSAATSANLLGVCTTCVTSAAALTSTAIMTGAGSQGSQTPDTTSTLSSGGVLALHTSTIPTFGTGAGEEFQACGTAPTLVASTSFLYCNASNFADVSTGTTDLGPVVAESSIIGANLIPKAIGTNPGVAASSITDDSKNITTSEVFVGGNKVNLTSDFTDSTSGSLVLITGLSYTLPTSKAVNVSFHCMLLYDQGSAAVVDEFGIGVTGTAPTQANASATVYTSTTASTTGTLTALASTTPTLVASFTPSAITTIWKAELDGTIEQPSNATPGVFSLYAFTTTGSDNLIVKRGSFCTLF